MNSKLQNYINKQSIKQNKSPSKLTEQELLDFIDAFRNKSIGYTKPTLEARKQHRRMKNKIAKISRKQNRSK